MRLVSNGLFSIGVSYRSIYIDNFLDPNFYTMKMEYSSVTMDSLNYSPKDINLN